MYIEIQEQPKNQTKYHPNQYPVSQTDIFQFINHHSPSLFEYNSIYEIDIKKNLTKNEKKEIRK